MGATIRFSIMLVCWAAVTTKALSTVTCCFTVGNEFLQLYIDDRNVTDIVFPKNQLTWSKPSLTKYVTFEEPSGPATIALMGRTVFPLRPTMRMACSSTRSNSLWNFASKGDGEWRTISSAHPQDAVFPADWYLNSYNGRESPITKTKPTNATFRSELCGIDRNEDESEKLRIPTRNSFFTFRRRVEFRTSAPSFAPTFTPTSSPEASVAPSSSPPTSTNTPLTSPTMQTSSPSAAFTPTSTSPSFSPSTVQPTQIPSFSPSVRSSMPTKAPTSSSPSKSPSSSIPTRAPTVLPSTSPTVRPTTRKPTLMPSSSRPTSAAPSRSPGYGKFNIRLMNTTKVSAAQLRAFERAAARWESIITEDFGSAVAVTNLDCGIYQFTQRTVVDDLLIVYAIKPIDGINNIVGQAGPCGIDSLKRPRIGTMEFDSADVDEMVRSGRFDSVVLHEMGHVLGLGSLWNYLGLSASSTASPTPFQATRSPTRYTSGLIYTGLEGNAGNRQLGYPGAALVEDQYGEGTKGSHWSEAQYDNELMTGFIEDAGVAMPISVLTVRALRDLGYTTDEARADTYSKPTGTAGRRLRSTRMQMKNDIKIRPLVELPSVPKPGREKDAEREEREYHERRQHRQPVEHNLIR